jgi:hypothetical protein
MTLVDRGARISLATILGVALAASSVFSAHAADESPPPTADLPGTNSIGTLATPDSKSPPPASSSAVPDPALAVPSPVGSEEPPPSAQTEAPAPEPSASPKMEDVVVDVKQDEPDWPNINKKKYLDYHSHWAVQVDVSPGALGRNLSLGGQDGNGNAVNSQPWGVGMQLEYQPEWFQKMGILSFGPSVNLYPAFSSNDDFPNAEAIWSIGAQIRYQFRYKEQQFLVPMLGFNYEKLSYHLVTEGTGSLTIAGPVAGLNILLNDLDKMNATAFYFDAGVLKTYLVLEGRLMEGDNGVMDVSGLSWFFGIRMEF